MTGTSPRASVSDTKVWQLEVFPSAEAYCGATPTEWGTLLGYRSVVDHQHGIPAADEPVRLDKQFCFDRRCIPDPGGNEVVQLIIFAERESLRHRRNALAIAGTDQPRHVERTHLSPRLVTQPIQKRLEKVSKLLFPIEALLTMVGPSKSRPPMSHPPQNLPK
jgi:hypothetical protein